jgi:hypothetical protein
VCFAGQSGRPEEEAHPRLASRDGVRPEPGDAADTRGEEDQKGTEKWTLYHCQCIIGIIMWQQMILLTTVCQIWIMWLHLRQDWDILIFENWKRKQHK